MGCKVECLQTIFLFNVRNLMDRSLSKGVFFKKSIIKLSILFFDTGRTGTDEGHGRCAPGVRSEFEKSLLHKLNKANICV